MVFGQWRKLVISASTPTSLASLRYSSTCAFSSWLVATFASTNAVHFDRPVSTRIKPSGREPFSTFFEKATSVNASIFARFPIFLPVAAKSAAPNSGICARQASTIECVRPSLELSANRERVWRVRHARLKIQSFQSFPSPKYHGAHVTHNSEAQTSKSSLRQSLFGSASLFMSVTSEFPLKNGGNLLGRYCIAARARL
jgi:hypothetical protein